MTALDQRSTRLATSVPARVGTSNDEPSRRVRSVSAIVTGSRGSGGGAGRVRRPAASDTIALTMPPRTDSVIGRASARSSAVTGPGMAEASSSSSVVPSSAGDHRTESSRLSSSPCWRPRRRVRTVGTIEPSATRRMAHTATRPSQVTLLPRASSSWPPPTAASQPSASPTGRASAGAAPPLGRRTGGWLVQPLSSTPCSPSRCSSSSDDAGSVPGPAAHTTSRPAAQEACRRTSPADSSRIGAGSSPSVPTRRRSAASRRSRSSSKSEMTCSRTGESSVRTRSRSSSVRCSSRSSDQRQAERCSASISNWAEVASAAAAASTANSKPGGTAPVRGAASCGRSVMSDTCCNVLLGSLGSVVPTGRVHRRGSMPHDGC